MAMLDAIRERWSPTIFSERLITSEELRELFEAVRWAPSSMNEQPWRLLYATRETPDAFERMVSCLVESNAQWARHAPLLVLVAAGTRFSRNERENRHAWHDAGMATENLLIQASSMGIQGHPMAGFSRSKAVELFGIPDGFETILMIALGYPGDLEEAPDGVEGRQKEARERKPLDETVFSDHWGEPPAFLRAAGDSSANDPGSESIETR
ncbi:nitroreductase family protein [Candidatus Zixiibacteriota bacterium]